MKISATIITKNEEKRLPKTIESLLPCVDEILVVDSESSDHTIHIAKKLGARTITQPWLGYCDQKNFASAAASYPWILSIDADETLSPELQSAIQTLKKSNPDPETAFILSRKSNYLGTWIHHGDWNPDNIIRLFHRDHSSFTGKYVHESVSHSGTTKKLTGHLFHHTYTSIEHRNQKWETYARLWAQEKFESGKKVSTLSPWTHAAATFFRGYLLKLGFLDKRAGLNLAWANAGYTYQKYNRLLELNTSQKPSL